VIFHLDSFLWSQKCSKCYVWVSRGFFKRYEALCALFLLTQIAEDPICYCFLAPSLLMTTTGAFIFGLSFPASSPASSPSLPVSSERASSCRLSCSRLSWVCRAIFCSPSFTPELAVSDREQDDYWSLSVLYFFWDRPPHLICVLVEPALLDCLLLMKLLLAWETRQKSQVLVAQNRHPHCHQEKHCLDFSDLAVAFQLLSIPPCFQQPLLKIS